MAAHADYPDGDELRAFVQIGGKECIVVFEGGTSWPRRAEFFRAVPSSTALWWQPAHQRRQLVASRTDRDVAAGASFAQVNEGVANAMRQYVVDRILAADPRTVIDGYAGIGTTASALASRGIAVTAIEVD